MPLFAIIARNRPDAANLRAENRPAHLDHVASLGDRLNSAGPLLDEAGEPAGSLVIADFSDLAAARAFARDDPYARAGLFQEQSVQGWTRVLP
ncbi:YciI family protein [Sphingomonas sp.]|uniref:YciI family protein n=1 Tax=Sphingomonas sp. TaxID=28214 RepID=UPI003B0074CA